MTYYLYRIMDEDDKKKSLSVIPIVVFSFFHASAFSILPIFIFNFWTLFLVKKDPRFIRNAIEALGGFCIGFLMMMRVEPIYMSKNFMRLMEIKGISIPYYRVPLIILAAAVAAIAVSLLMLLLRDIPAERVLKAESVLAAVITVIAGVDFVSGRSWYGILNLRLIGVSTMMGYIMLSGFFLMPLIFLKLVFNVRKETKSYE